jgi:hypothetical protein
MRRPLLLPAVALTAGLALAACGGGDSTAGGSATSSTEAAPSSTVAVGAKVDANTASKAEIAAALDAAGVPNAGRWADEVTEYRPYPTDDPTFAKLRSELEKYHPADGVVDRIVSALTL